MEDGIKGVGMYVRAHEVGSGGETVAVVESRWWLAWWARWWLLWWEKGSVGSGIKVRPISRSLPRHARAPSLSGRMDQPTVTTRDNRPQSSTPAISFAGPTSEEPLYRPIQQGCSELLQPSCQHGCDRHRRPPVASEPLISAAPAARDRYGPRRCNIFLVRLWPNAS
ncbi:hypothetical protein K402DRAFT_407548 [Aulographum hederae CBS 113979]|uniref:Uncharacterized protein n=1 Tax=Aulographum hederae CBS 113979 TaxID=1176131 RepID=A0A6G1GP58_9PEZI|nr:hypothetical protein K402DRAFT_407548 [Aulographum hederae CBS 113979]